MNEKQKQQLKITLISFFSFLVLIYLGFQVYQVVKPPLSTEVVSSHTVSDSVETKGFVVRNESYLENKSKGTLIPMIDDGSRVSKGEAVAAVFTDESAAAGYSTMVDLKENLARYQRLNSQSSSYAVNINSVNANISKSVIDLVEVVDSGDLSELTDRVFDVRDELVAKQIATGETTALDSIIAGITTHFTALGKQNATYNTITSDASGYYFNGTDGYETTVDYGLVDKMTVKDIKKVLDADAKKVPKNAFGKVFKDFDWYILCVVDSNKVGDLGVDKKVTITLPYSGVNSVPAVVEAINAGADDKQTALVLRCNYMNSGIAQLRKETVQIVMDTKTGIKISSKAIRVNDKGEKGVFVKSGNVCKFKKVDIIYSEKGWVLSAPQDEKGYVAQYDTVILEGKGLYDGKNIS